MKSSLVSLQLEVSTSVIVVALAVTVATRIVRVEQTSPGQVVIVPLTVESSVMSVTIGVVRVA